MSGGVHCIVYSGPFDGFRFTLTSPYATLFIRKYEEGAVVDPTYVVYYTNQRNTIPHKLFRINDEGLHEYRPFFTPIPSEVTNKL
jgi:hypothetical protein